MHSPPQTEIIVLLVSAVASAQGKTTAALARRLVREGGRVRLFKTDPDLLDPMILERAYGTRHMTSICGSSDGKNVDGN